MGKQEVGNADQAAKVEKNRTNGSKGGRPQKTERLTETKPNGLIRASGSDSGSESSGGGSAEGGSDPPQGFARFWAAYPGKRTDKRRCLAIWLGKKPLSSGEKRELESNSDAICGAVEAQDRAKHHVYDRKTMWPNAPTWLYNARWDDDVSKAANGSAFDALDAETHQRLFEAVCKADPDTHHMRGKTDTERAMRALARKEKLL